MPAFHDDDYSKYWSDQWSIHQGAKYYLPSQVYDLIGNDIDQWFRHTAYSPLAGNLTYVGHSPKHGSIFLGCAHWFNAKHFYEAPMGESPFKARFPIYLRTGPYRSIDLITPEHFWTQLQQATLTPEGKIELRKFLGKRVEFPAQVETELDWLSDETVVRLLGKQAEFFPEGAGYYWPHPKSRFQLQGIMKMEGYKNRILRFREIIHDARLLDRGTDVSTFEGWSLFYQWEKDWALFSVPGPAIELSKDIVPADLAGPTLYPGVAMSNHWGKAVCIIPEQTGAPTSVRYSTGIASVNLRSPLARAWGYSYFQPEFGIEIVASRPFCQVHDGDSGSGFFLNNGKLWGTMSAYNWGRQVPQSEQEEMLWHYEQYNYVASVGISLCPAPSDIIENYLSQR